MEYVELKDMVKHGMEYNFYFENEEYWISHNDDGYYVTRVRDSYSQEFKTSEELFLKAKINKKTISALWMK